MLLLVGGYTLDMGPEVPGKAKGLAAYRFNSRNGKLRYAGYTPTINPSYLWVDERPGLIYTIRECPHDEGAAVVGFRIRPSGENVDFEKIGEAAIPGDHPCHLTGVDDTLIVSSYSSGTVHVFPRLADGGIGPALQRIELPRAGSDRQPHAHCAAYDERRKRVYICDLGSDRLRVFSRDETGRLALLPDHGIAFSEGAGPRHIALHPGGDFAVVICELRGDTMLIDLRQDRPRLMDRTGYLPERVADQASGAAIRLDANGKYAYLSDRTFSVIVQMRLEVANGRYTNKETYPSGGERPRDLSLSPDGRWLLAANSKSHSLSVFQVGSGGSLQLYHVITKVPSPTCLKWLELASGDAAHS